MKTLFGKMLKVKLNNFKTLTQWFLISNKIRHPFPSKLEQSENLCSQCIKTSQFRIKKRFLKTTSELAEFCLWTFLNISRNINRFKYVPLENSKSVKKTTLLFANSNFRKNIWKFHEINFEYCTENISCKNATYS